MSVINTTSNYGGKQANNSAYIKQFVTGVNNLVTWIYNTTSVPNLKTITPSDPAVSVLVQNDLIVFGNITTPSDLSIKENIHELDPDFCNKIMELEPKQYNYIDKSDKIHYGFIAQEMETLFPHLVNELQVNEDEPSIKTINYMEFIPVLLLKIQSMQKDIDELKKNNL
jgi:glucose-6-phosphate isomerase